MSAEFRSLTGVRAVAAVGVVVFHMVGQYPGAVSHPIIGKILHFGGNGVDLFFILSGFILAYSYEAIFLNHSKNTYLLFLQKRLARIFPAHLFALLLMLILGLGLRALGNPFFENNGLRDFLAQLFLVSNWNPLKDAVLNWNVPSWSISSEWLAYLLFPILLHRIRYFSKSLLYTLAFGLPFLMASSYYFGPANFGLIRVLCEFPAGIALYFLFNKFRSSFSASLWDRFGSMAAILYVTVGMTLGLLELNVRWAVIFIPPILISLALSKSTLAMTLAKPFPVYLGRISYSLYITHYFVLSAMRFLFISPRFQKGNFFFFILTLVEIIVIYIVARATYRFVELPGQKLLASSISQRNTQSSI